MSYRLLLCWSLALSVSLSAQNVLPIGSWRTHFPQRNGTYVTQSDDQIFFATTGAVMIIDKDEIAPRFISKVDGLSGVDIQLLKYHKPTETLLIVYRSGRLDLWRKDGEVVTVNSIANFTNIVGEKRVNKVFVGEDNLLFFATTFGVSVFQIDRAVFPFTTFMGELNVRDVTIHGGYLYAATEEGIYRIVVDSPVIDDFEAWEYLGMNRGLPGVYNSHALAVYNGELYLGVNEDIYRWENEAAVLFADLEEGHNLHYMTGEGTHLLVGYRCDEAAVCGDSRAYYYRADGSGGRLAPDCIGLVNNAIEDERGRVWFGDEYEDFRYLDNVEDSTCNRFSFREQGPYRYLAWDLAMADGKLWVATGAVTPTKTPRFLDWGVAQFADGRWRILNRWTNEAFRGRNPDPNFRDDDVFTIIDVEVNRVTNKVYAASYYAGLIEIDGETVRLYNDQDSPLSNTINDESRTRVSGLRADEEGNLWVSNYNPVEGAALHRLAPDGTWTSFPNTGGASELFQIDIDPNGFKWIIDASSSKGVLVYDEGDINNPGDDRRRVFTAANSELPTNETNCLVVDNDGDVWVGTNAGIIIFECGATAFEPNCQGSLRIVELDGFLEYLFKTQAILALAVDGANRKWVGTANNGLYLISEDG
ncbi:MAG: hypothetical protein D6772_08180, partial [Bacteroidetes bacterium]